MVELLAICYASCVMELLAMVNCAHLQIAHRDRLMEERFSDFNLKQNVFFFMFSCFYCIYRKNKHIFKKHLIVDTNGIGKSTHNRAPKVTFSTFAAIHQDSSEGYTTYRSIEVILKRSIWPILTTDM